TTTMTAGEARAFSALGFDAFGNQLGDLTAATSFAIDAGSCDGASCNSTAAGPHQVTATSGALRSVLSIHVLPSSLYGASLLANDTLTAGGSLTVVVQGTDRFGNDVGDLGSTAALAIAPDGSCAERACTATAAGWHLITATAQSVTATTGATVVPGPLAAVAVDTGSGPMAAGDTRDVG